MFSAALIGNALSIKCVNVRLKTTVIVSVLNRRRVVLIETLEIVNFHTPSINVYVKMKEFQSERTPGRTPCT